jgi:hypothetical protein
MTPDLAARGLHEHVGALRLADMGAAVACCRRTASAWGPTVEGIPGCPCGTAASLDGPLVHDDGRLLHRADQKAARLEHSL